MARRARYCVAAWAVLLGLGSPARAERPIDKGAQGTIAGGLADGGMPGSSDGGTASTGGPSIESPDGGSGLSAADQAALEKALQADSAAKNAATQQAAGAASQQAPASPSGAWSNAANALHRAYQSLNPDISAIVDFAAGLYSGDGIVKSGDDPGDTGANLQEVELALSATVDPYFRADVFLTIPNATGIEVEEAFVTTTSLPGSLQLRAGIFRAPFGRQNTQHLHLQDFTRRPQMNALLLGPDGLRAPGMEVSWLTPLPFYLLVTAAAFSVSPPDTTAEPLHSFGGGTRSDFTYLGNLKTFAALGDTVSLLAGLSFASGKSAKLVDSGNGSTVLQSEDRSYVYGADLYLKWKPPNVSQTYMSLGWTTEYVLRQIPAQRELEGSLYSQIAWQVARRWVLGVRGEVQGLPSGPWVPRQYAGAGSLTWSLSEFARVRLYGEGRYTPGDQLGGPAAPTPKQGWSSAAFLQMEVSIGAHGAHAY